MTRQITIENERINHIALTASECIRIINGEKGWMAQINAIAYIGGGAVRYTPVGEKIGVNRFINAQDGGEKIAALFGK